MFSNSVHVVLKTAASVCLCWPAMHEVAQLDVNALVALICQVCAVSYCVRFCVSLQVGFTDMSRTLEPSVVMSFMSELFAALDDLAEQHGVFKVGTAGDAYIVAGGLIARDENGFQVRGWAMSLYSPNLPLPTTKALACHRLHAACWMPRPGWQGQLLSTTAVKGLSMPLLAAAVQVKP